MIKRLLIIAKDPLQLRRRTESLRKAGFEVVAVSSEEADAIGSDDRSFSAIIIGHKVPSELRTYAARTAKTRFPRCKVIMLHMGSLEHTELADAVITASEDEALIRALKSLGLEANPCNLKSG